MQCQVPDGVPRETPLPPGIRDEPRGGTHTSSADDAASLGEHVIPRNWHDPAGPNLIATPDRLIGPKSLNLIRLSEIKTLDDFLRGQSSRCGRKPHSFNGELVHRE
jgi:hypothetical protein